MKTKIFNWIAAAAVVMTACTKSDDTVDPSPETPKTAEELLAESVQGVWYDDLSEIIGAERLYEFRADGTMEWAAAMLLTPDDAESLTIFHATATWKPFTGGQNWLPQSVRTLMPEYFDTATLQGIAIEGVLDGWENYGVIRDTMYVFTPDQAKSEHYFIWHIDFETLAGWLDGVSEAPAAMQARLSSGLTRADEAAVWNLAEGVSTTFAEKLQSIGQAAKASGKAGYLPFLGGGSFFETTGDPATEPALVREYIIR